MAAHNKEMLREKKLSIAEEKLGEAVLFAKSLGLSLDELIELLQLLYEEEE